MPARPPSKMPAIVLVTQYFQVSVDMFLQNMLWTLSNVQKTKETNLKRLQVGLKTV